MNEFTFNEITANFTSKERTAKLLADCWSLVNHYEKGLNLNLFKLSFERLVTDTDATIKELETFTGLSGLIFNSMGAEKAGIGRWTRYGDHLTEISKILSATIKDQGYVN
jgi:hypothetical protein